MQQLLSKELHDTLYKTAKKIVDDAVTQTRGQLTKHASNGENNIRIKELTEDQAKIVRDYLLEIDQSEMIGRLYIREYSETIDIGDPFCDNPVEKKYELRYIIDKSLEPKPIINRIIREYWFPITVGIVFLSEFLLKK